MRGQTVFLTPLNLGEGAAVDIV